MMQRILSLLTVLCLTLHLAAYDSKTDVKLSGRIIASPGNNPQWAFDGDANTYFQAHGYEMKWVGLELDTTYVITRLRFRPMNSSLGEDNMQLSVFEGANRPDFMDAVPLYLIPSKPSRGTYSSIDVEVTRAFRYVRYVGSSGSYCRVAELEFYGHQGEGKDSIFYQVSNIPTVSIHVENEANPWNKGEDFNAFITNIYDGGKLIQEYPISTRVRGNYSASHDNKPYRVKFEDGKKHHMLKDGVNESNNKAKKWVLVNSYRDKTLLRNPMAYNVSKRIKPIFTPWSQQVDLLLNGDYHGTYTLCDHVSVGNGRIDITEMEPTDIEGEALTGGYFFEADNNYSGEKYHWLSSHGNTMSMHSPDDEVAQPQQFEYLKNFFARFENRLYGNNYLDTISGYPTMLDLTSFLKHFLISEFNGNTDMICQVFMYKHRGDDHIYTGPVWDHDLALENDITVYPGNEREDWTYPVRQTGQWGSVLNRVLSDPAAMAELQELWAQVRDDSLITSKSLEEMVDSFRVDTRASAALNFLRWPYLLQNLSLNPRVWGSWEAEMDNVKRYVSGRVAWMDKKLHYTGIDTIGGVYQIYTARELCQFANIVRDGESAAKAKILADIDMTNYSDKYVPFGTSGKPFTGTIEGGGHTIDNLHIKGEDYAALIKYSGACTISNLTLGRGCVIEGRNNVAGFIGMQRKDAATLTGCAFEGKVIASGVGAAGLVGSVYSNSYTVKMTDCYNAGSITANNRAAALVTPGKGRIQGTNLFNAGILVGVEDSLGFAHCEGVNKLSNCYDINASYDTERVTADFVQNGALCMALQAERTKTVWYQNLDNGKRHDEHPVLQSDHGTVFLEDGVYTNQRQMKKAYRYYRFDVSECGGGVIQMAEFGLLDAGLNEIPIEIYNGTESNIWGENWPNLADRKLDTKYCASFNGRAVFLFDAHSTVNIYGYRIYTANDTNTNPDRNPRSWKVYGTNTYTSDFDDEGWELIDDIKADTKLGATRFTPYDYIVRTPSATITLNRHSMTLDLDTLVQLRAEISPDIFATARVLWRSTDENVAVVDNGYVRTVGYGEAKIIAVVPDYGNVADTCRIRVLEPGAGFQYYMLELERMESGTMAQLSEFELMANDKTRPLSMYHFIGDAVGTHPASDMVDGKTTTKFCGSIAQGESAIYFFMDASEAFLPDAYRMITANDTQTYSSRNPRTWRLWGCNSKLTTTSKEQWTLLDEHIDDDTMQAYNYTPYKFLIDYTPTAIEQPTAIHRHSDVWTDLHGRRLPTRPSRPGVYIHDGRKVMVF